MAAANVEEAYRDLEARERAVAARAENVERYAAEIAQREGRVVERERALIDREARVLRSAAAASAREAEDAAARAAEADAHARLERERKEWRVQQQIYQRELAVLASKGESQDGASLRQLRLRAERAETDLGDARREHELTVQRFKDELIVRDIQVQEAQDVVKAVKAERDRQEVRIVKQAKELRVLRNAHRSAASLSRMRDDLDRVRKRLIRTKAAMELTERAAKEASPFPKPSAVPRFEASGRAPHHLDDLSSARAAYGDADMGDDPPFVRLGTGIAVTPEAVHHDKQLAAAARRHENETLSIAGEEFAASIGACKQQVQRSLNDVQVQLDLIEGRIDPSDGEDDDDAEYDLQRVSSRGSDRRHRNSKGRSSAGGISGGASFSASAMDDFDGRADLPDVDEEDEESDGGELGLGDGGSGGGGDGGVGGVGGRSERERDDAAAGRRLYAFDAEMEGSLYDNRGSGSAVHAGASRGTAASSHHSHRHSAGTSRSTHWSGDSRHRSSR